MIKTKNYKGALPPYKPRETQKQTQKTRTIEKDFVFLYV